MSHLETMIVEKIASSGDSVLLYGTRQNRKVTLETALIEAAVKNEIDYYIIAKQTDNIKIGNIVLYDPVGLNFGYFEAVVDNTKSQKSSEINSPKIRNSRNYLRRQTPDGIKISSFTEPPYDGLVEALLPGETLVLCYTVKYTYGKESNQGGHYVKYEPIRSQIQFDYLIGYYIKIKKNRRGKPMRSEQVLLSSPTAINPADIKGFYARPAWNASRIRYRQDATFAEAVDCGSSVRRPTEEAALSAVMAGISVDDIVLEERDF